ncbi:MAG: hypothetical protein EA342_15160 [Leptolyngbya sp. LCM1.Bin17]|nr:MAG: hypothetical protein EA342_15160 [Leptolyngbya sp. LCM1.Bin17]
MVGISPNHLVLADSMKKQRHCLPCYLIIRNVALMLGLIAGVLITAAEVQESVQEPSPEEVAMRRLVVLQIMMNND